MGNLVQVLACSTAAAVFSAEGLRRLGELEEVNGSDTWITGWKVLEMGKFGVFIRGWKNGSLPIGSMEKMIYLPTFNHTHQR